MLASDEKPTSPHFRARCHAHEIAETVSPLTEL
jgi:hypothetical protein